MTQSRGGAERRKQMRVPMKLPVRVQGYEPDGGAAGADEKPKG
jgi:hypothetical protein